MSDVVGCVVGHPFLAFALAWAAIWLVGHGINEFRRTWHPDEVTMTATTTRDDGDRDEYDVERKETL